MNAAEKLERLEARTITLHGQREMRRVLPQLLALVEAAQAYVRADKEYQRRIDVVDIRDALAALDEALT